MTVHSEDFDLKTFLNELDFSEESIQGYARYLCTQGNKENEFSLLLAKKLDEYLSHNYPNFYTVLQYNEKAMKDTGEDTKIEASGSFGYSKGSLGLFSDIAVINTSDSVTDIIEIKTDRHSAYVFEYIKSNSQDLSKILKNTFWKEKTLADIAKLLEKKKHFPGIRFWCGTILYSLERKTESPKKYGRYLEHDQAQRLNASQPQNVNDLDSECQVKCDAFKSAIIKIQDMIPDSGESRKGKNVKIDLKKEDLVHKIVARGLHRDVLVRSDLILFEVK